MKQNKKTVMIIGCITTICTFIAAVLIGWNHMVKITKGPKNEKEIIPEGSEVIVKEIRGVKLIVEREV